MRWGWRQYGELPHSYLEILDQMIEEERQAMESGR